VLNDPRAYLPVTETSFNLDSRYAHYRLDRQRGDTVAFTCRCGRGRVLGKAELIEAEGPSANVLWVARRVALRLSSISILDSWPLPTVRELGTGT
jgi:hypothetical protein